MTLIFSWVDIHKLYRCHTPVQQHRLWDLETQHCSSTAYNVSSANSTIQFNSIPSEIYRHHTAVQQHALWALQIPHCSSTACLTSSRDTKLQFNSIPYELYRHYIASLLQVHLPLGVQHIPDGTLLDRSRSIANHPTDDRSDSDHHSECFLTKEDH